MVRPAQPPRVPRRLEAMTVGDLADDDELEHREVDGELIGVVADRVQITESRLAGVRCTGSQFARLRMRDVVVERCDLSGVVLEGARLERCRFADCRLSGAVFAGAQLRHVRFDGCRMDATSFRMSSGQAVRWEDCDLTGADFYEAQLPSAQLLDCRLTGADFSRATMTGSELHGSELDQVGGVLALRDVVIDRLQVAVLAQAMLAAHGVTITDEPTDR